MAGVSMQAGPEAENLATNLRVLAALHGVLDLLGELPVVVFKGPLLTRRAYRHLGARASADNDLWVPGGAAPVALERLLTAGYVPSPHVDAHLALEQRGQVALWPGGNIDAISVDLHTRPFARPYFEVDEAVLLEHLEVDTASGRRIRTFDLPLAFCHLVAHYVQHHLADDQLELLARLWLMSVVPGQEHSAAPDPERPAGTGSLLALIERTCGRPAANLALTRAHALSILHQPPAFDAPRSAEVGRCLDFFDGAPPGVVRKLLALYLTAPRRLVPGILGSAFASSELLHERYGRGPRAWLLLRHLLRVLGER